MDNSSFNNNLDESYGKLTVAEDTVAFIANEEVMKVKGVIEVSTRISDGFKDIIGNDHLKGIRVEVGDKQTIVNIPICVSFGVDILKTARMIQELVAVAITEATELEVKEVNVTIDDIRDANLDEESHNSEGWNGSIEISPYVVAYIARKVTMGINGVSDMSRGIAGEIAGMISKRNEAKGVKVEVGAKEAVINLFVIVKFGCRIPDIAWSIQEKVKAEVERMTKYKVKEVNIAIQGIDFDNEYVEGEM